MSGNSGNESTRERYPIHCVIGDRHSLHKRKGVISQRYLSRLSRRWRWFKKRGVAITLFWSFTAFIVFLYLISEYISNPSNCQKNDRNFLIMFSLSILFPIAGWFTDAFIGRYKIIKISMIVMWISSTLFCLIPLLHYHVSAMVYFHRLVIILLCIGFGGFQVNIIHFGIDQLPDSSSSDIISYIMWYAWTSCASVVTLQLTHDCTKYCKYYRFLFPLFLCGLLSVALCLDFLFTHLLIKEPVTHNPLKLIFRVLLYATKNKYPRNRSALMYWDNKWYSRINLCKNKFGGPFSAKEVEDVKSFFWIICMLFLGLLIFGGLVGHTDRVSSVFVYRFQDANYREAASHCMIKDCLSKLVISNFGYIVMVVSVPLYEFLIMPILWKCLMEMKILKQLVIGGLLIFMGILSVMALQVAGQLERDEADTNTTECLLDTCSKSSVIYKLSHYWLIVPSLVSIMGRYVVGVAGVKFVCAKSPYSMKGLIFGILYVSLAFSFILMYFITYTVIKYVPSDGAVLGCVFWYLLTCAVITLILVFILFIVIYCYNKREKEDDSDTVSSRERITDYHAVTT